MLILQGMTIDGSKSVYRNTRFVRCDITVNNIFYGCEFYRCRITSDKVNMVECVSTDSVIIAELDLVHSFISRCEVNFLRGSRSVVQDCKTLGRDVNIVFP